MNQAVSRLRLVALAGTAILITAFPLFSQRRLIPRSISKDIKKEIQGLQSDDARRRIKAAINLSSMGESAAPAIPFLIDLLADEEAVDIQSQTDNLNIVVQLTPAVAAKGTLKNLGASAAELLVEAMTTRESLIRVGAAETLWSINKDPRVMSALVAAMGDPDQRVRIHAAGALGPTQDPGALEALINALKDPVPQVRAAAAEALGSISNPLAVDPLRLLLKDENDDVRLQAANTLKKLGWKPEDQAEQIALLAASRDWAGLRHLGEAAVPALIEMLRTAGWSVAWRASEILKQVGDSAIDPLLVALKDENRQLRFFAAKALNGNPDPRVLDALISAVYDQDSSVVMEAAEGLRRIQDPRHLGGLCEILMSERIVVNSGKIDAAEALGRLKDRRATPALLSALKEKDPFIREAAASALAEIQDPTAAESLLQALEDSVGDVRITAAEALWKSNRDIRALDVMIAAAGGIRVTVQAESRLERMLREITGQSYKFGDKAWQKWWTANRTVFLQKRQESPESPRQ